MNRLHSKRKRLLRFELFESASRLTLQDMKLSDDLVDTLKDLKSRDLLDYWVELGDDLEGTSEEPVHVENVPILHIQFDSDRIRRVGHHRIFGEIRIVCVIEEALHLRCEL